MNCWKCERKLAADAAFCHHCGEPASKICSACGGFNHPDGIHCRHCGQSMDSDDEPMTAEDETPERDAAAEPIQQRATLADLASYKSPRADANWVVGLLVADILVTAMLAAVVFLLYVGVARWAAGEDATVFEYIPDFLTEETAGSIEGFLTYGEYALLIFAAVVFLMWHFRASKNLQAFVGTEQSYTPGWSMVVWFIPILNLFLPCAAIIELWKGSDRRILTDVNFDWTKARGAGFVVLWWIFWVASSCGSRIVEPTIESGFTALNAPSVTDPAVIASEFASMMWVIAILSALTITAAILAILVVRRITRRQETIYRLAVSGGVSQNEGESPQDIPLRVAAQMRIRRHNTQTRRRTPLR